MRAWRVAECSAQLHAGQSLDIRRVSMTELMGRGLYRRPTTIPGQGPAYWDDISGAPMSTGHAIARFLVPHLCGYQGWALFTDGDVLFRRDVRALFALADPRMAVQVVQHAPMHPASTKMDGQAQAIYTRKNWSSVVLWNCGHPAHAALTVDMVNTAPGRDLHRFCWLADDQIGALRSEWNVLIGEQHHPDPALAHFTLGVPDTTGYEHQPFADEWFAMARAAGYRLRQPAREGVA
jgi:hypothetical protein